MRLSLFIALLWTSAEAFSPIAPSSSSTHTQARSTTRLAMQPTNTKPSGLTPPLRDDNDIGTSTQLQAVAVEDPAVLDSGTSAPATTAKSWEDDGFIFGLEGSGLERPKGKTAVLVLDGDTLETQPYQRAIVYGTFAGHAAFLGTSVAELLSHNHGNVALTAAQVGALTVSSWLAADLGSGILHWSVDNYGNGRTPIMGGIIAAFQGHHSAQWTITEREFCNNVYKLCTPFGVATMSAIAFVTGPSVTFFLTIFCMLEILSQEFHKWSHQTKSEVPAYVNALQESGLTIARTQHAQHHMAPYKGNYCIVSGTWNQLLDESGFFRRLESIVYRLNGVEANAWKLDPALRERTLAGDYSLPTKSK